jgi:hypothetical protein
MQLEGFFKPVRGNPSQMNPAHDLNPYFFKVKVKLSMCLIH